jgi:SanA protein
MKYLLNLAAIFTGTFFWALCANLWIERSTEQYLFDNLYELPEKDAALVLGANRNGRYGINSYFKQRMIAAADLYFSGKVKQLIVSGDNHIKTYDETTDMAEYLIGLGVPDSAIIRDYAGFRTLDSVVRAQKVFHCNSLIIVSQEFHNERAVFIARHFEIDAVGYNALDVASKSNYTHLREIGAKFLTILDLYLLNTQPKFL